MSMFNYDMTYFSTSMSISMDQLTHTSNCLWRLERAKMRFFELVALE